jgi:CDP-glucose 4,6-dehydratase
MENLALIGVDHASFWRGKRVVVTGHSGFKGSWLTLWLDRLGALVTGISLPPMTTPNLFSAAKVGELCQSHFFDIRDPTGLAELIRMSRPEIVFHLAAQPLVRAGYRAPLATFETNVMGTAHALEALRGIGSVRVAVMVTTDKVYRDHGRPEIYGENDPLGGYDPYSASKAATEIVVECYRKSYLAAEGVTVASARAGNVIGGGDWSEERLIPDAVRAWQAGKALEVRRPAAVRPWQHVLEPLSGYLTLAQKLWEGSAPAGAYNFGPGTGEKTSVRDVIQMACRAYGAGNIKYGDGKKGPHESDWLALDSGKARTTLGVAPRLTLAQAVDRTMAWYRAYEAGEDARQLCEADIALFTNGKIRRAGRRAAAAVL